MAKNHLTWKRFLVISPQSYCSITDEKIVGYVLGTAIQTHIWMAIFFGGRPMPALLMIDNYDSFTYNLVQMFRRYPLEVNVFRNDAIDVAMVRKMAPDYIVISPGPKAPSHAGVSISLIHEFYRDVPILGVCLGMQCINEAFGGQTIRSPNPLHGRTSSVRHEGEALFAGIPSPMKAARYHSLAVQPCQSDQNDALKITAHADDGVIMGLSHRRFHLYGIQFHPESFLTENGVALIDNFLRTGALYSSHDTHRQLQ
jgi:anthranilate synthase component 2